MLRATHPHQRSVCRLSSEVWWEKRDLVVKRELKSLEVGNRCRVNNNNVQKSLSGRFVRARVC